MATFEPPTTKRRLIIKFSYERDDDDEKKKPIVTSYWVTGERSTTTKSQEESVKKDVVVDSTFTTNIIVAAAADDHNKVSSSTPTKPLKQNSKVSDVALAARNGKRKHPSVDSRNGCDGNLKKKKKKKDGAETELLMINNVTNEAKTPSSDKDHPPKTENCGLKRNDGIAQLMKKEKKKPMENYKRMQCWVILKNMIEGRDGWALKHPLDPNYLNGLEKNIDSKTKPRCLRDIEAKLNSYSTPNEFAEDMRSVFSHGMLYPPSDEYKIAKRFSDIFENKWKTLKMEWGFEDRRRLNKNIHKMLKIQGKRKR